MPRSLYQNTIMVKGPAGAIPLAGAAVTFRDPVDGLPIAYPLYADGVSLTPLTLPYVTGVLGELEVWADLPHRVRIDVVKGGLTQAQETIDLEYPPEYSATTEDITQAIEAHEAKADPHDQYLTQDEADLAYLKLTGGTLSGTLVAPRVDLNVPVAPLYGPVWQIAGATRWYVAVQESETGGDAGSNFALIRNKDDGAGETVLYISRSLGDISTGAALSVGSYLTVATSAFIGGKAVAASPDAGNILVWNANGFYVAASATYPTLDTRYEQLSRKGAASGYVPLGADTKIPNAYLPDLAITNTFVVASQAEMLALNAQTGDVCVRLDTTENYILAAEPATVLANWTKLAASTTAGNTTIVKREEFAPAAASTSVALAAVPTQMLSVSRNGVEQSQPAGHYTVAGVTVTFTDAFVAGERVSVVYEVGSSAPAPINGYTKVESDQRYVDVAGDTMTGALSTTSRFQAPIIRVQDPGSIAAYEWYYQNSSDLVRLRYGSDAGGFTETGIYAYANGALWSTTMSVGGFPVQVSPDASNALEWRANGFFATGGMSQATADTRYLQLTGGALTGKLTITVPSDFSVNPLETRMAGDANPRFRIDSTGTVRFGDGTASPDTTLYRLGAGSLATGGHFSPGSSNTQDLGAIGARWKSAYLGTVLSIAGASATANQITHAITTDAQPRLIVDGNGKMRWGPGAAVAQDTSLERTGAGALRLSGATNSGLEIRGTGSASGTRFSQMANGARYDIAGNAYFDGANWNLDDTTKYGQVVQGSDSNPLAVYTITPGANPVSGGRMINRAIINGSGTLAVTPDTGQPAFKWGLGELGDDGSGNPLLKTVGALLFVGRTTSYTKVFGNSVYLDSAAGGGVFPERQDAVLLGTSTNRWAQVWCTAGAFSGSHVSLKENFAPLDPAACAQAVLDTDWLSYDYKAPPPPEPLPVPEDETDEQRAARETVEATNQTLIEGNQEAVALARKQKGYVLGSSEYHTADLFGMADRQNASTHADMAVVACALQEVMRRLAIVEGKVV